MSNLHKIVARIGAAALVWAVSVLPAGCTPPPPPPPRAEAPPVHVATVTSRDVPIHVKAVGWVEPYNTVTVKPLVDGQIVDLKFEPGEHVRAGQPLVTIDRRPFESALREAQANLARDQAMASDAARDADRLAALFAAQQASQREIEESRATADARQAQVTADEAAVEAAQLRLDYCEIASPVDGVIGARLADRGNVVKLNETALLVINRVKPIYVRFAVAERHLADIRASLARDKLPIEVNITGDDRGPELGELSFIDNQVDTATGMVRMRGVFPNESERLWPGQYVDVAMTIAMRRDAVIAPPEAVQIGQRGRYVFVIKADQTAEMRPVTIERAIEAGLIVSSGLAAGDVVATDGQLRVVPGKPVAVLDREATTRPGESR